MSFSLEIFSVAVVLVGDFNPSIFTPDWLENHQLIGPGDAQFARENESIVISHQVTRFDTEWFQLQVLEEQFSITSKGNVSASLKDLVTGIFSLLTHTPVRAIGINTIAHFKIDTQENFQKIGNIFAPKDIWKELFDEKLHLGMENLAIRVQPVDEKGNYINEGNAKLITIQPSAKIVNGVYFMLNDHHTVKSESSDETNAQSAIKLLQENWETQISSSTSIFEVALIKAIKS